MSADDDHYALVAKLIVRGDVIPFLGAGVNLCGRRPATFKPGGKYLPSGIELTEYLATEWKYPPGETRELQRVSQFVEAEVGPWKLHQDLRRVFTADYAPNKVHTFLACLARRLRAEKVEQQLVITTNYDDALERAYDQEGEEYDVVYYDARPGDTLGKFYHRPPGGVAVQIPVLNEFEELEFDKRPVILKIHGAVDRQEPENDSYVITEDDYIDYLTQDAMRSFATLKKRMGKRNFLFLGYSLQDWNLRVMLNQIWDERGTPEQSWAIQKVDPSRAPRSIEVERKLWERRGAVEVRFEDLLRYVERLSAHIEIPDPAQAATTTTNARA